VLSDLKQRYTDDDITRMLSVATWLDPAVAILISYEMPVRRCKVTSSVGSRDAEGNRNAC